MNFVSACKMRFNVWTILLVFLFKTAVVRSTDQVLDNKAKPFDWSAASTWDGNDGNWSTFTIRVDKAPNEQYARVLPATDSFETWIVSAQSCRKNDTMCISQRGGSLNTTNSSSWESQGPYQLEMASYLFNYSDPKWETNFSLPPRGDYGLATLGLTRLPSALTLNKQVVATFEAVGFYLGFFGLASDDIDFGDGIRHPSYLTTLYNKSMIPSTSWGYQAGAAYRGPGRTASLVLGGYDAGRFKPNSATFNLTAVETKEIQAPLTSLAVKLSDGTALDNILTKPVNVSINSATSYIWLPLEACQQLEKTLNITWNVTEELYLLEPWTYQALVAANPNFTFTLANGTSKVDITVPYAALDLNVVLPINRVVPRNQTQKYFPVKRSTDKSQYTLGRAFLQEAYLQVDYHRRIFNISQAAWPESDFASDPKPLYPPSNNTQTATANPKNSTSVSDGLSQSQKNGAIAGGVIGGVLLLCALLLVAMRIRTGQWWPLGFGKRRSAVPVQVPELDAKKELVEAEGDTRQPEELDAGRDGGVAEMEAQERSPSELAKMRQEYTGS